MYYVLIDLELVRLGFNFYLFSLNWAKCVMAMLKSIAIFPASPAQICQVLESLSDLSIQRNYITIKQYMCRVSAFKLSCLHSKFRIALDTIRSCHIFP